MAVHVTSSQEREKKSLEFLRGRAIAEGEGKKPELQGLTFKALPF